MTATPQPAVLRCLIEGRDYEWVPSTRADFHSFCYVVHPDGDQRVAALRPHPRRTSGWQLLWGSDENVLLPPPWAPRHVRYVLDGRDAVSRELPRFLLDHPLP
jgi:hypothetical protein